MITQSIKLLAPLFILLLIIGSCKKKEDITDHTSETDMALAQVGFDDIEAVMNDAIKDEDKINKTGENNGSLAGPCATITFTDLTQFPVTVTIDFGPTNCTGNDGRNRRGIVTAVFSGRYRDSASSVTITPDNYYVENYKIEGTKTITNMGQNANGNLEYSVEVVGGKITTPANETITWESSRTNEWVEGESTIFNPFDDVYLISGTGSGVNRDGLKFDAEIMQPLRIEIGCRWITEGVLDIRPENLTTRTIDYGAGICDNKATVEVGGNVFNFTMQ